MLSCLAAALTLAAAQAAELPSNPLEQRCWLSHSRERSKVNLRETTAAEFSNLRHGYTVRSPLAVDFAVRGMGVAPAGVKQDGTGHHHILINRPMPSSVTEKIPFDDGHRHFGKGQTGTSIELPPGRHTLRLLFADHEHRPHFVFSREIEVNVRGARHNTARPQIDAANFAATCQAWYEDEVSSPAPPDERLRIMNVRANEALVSPFNLRLGVSGLGICASGAKCEQGGHFVLDLLDAFSRRPVQTFDLKNGATQVNVFTLAGRYLARLRLVDAKGDDLLPALELPLRVVREELL